VFGNFLPPQFPRFARSLGINIAIKFLRNSYSVRSLLNLHFWCLFSRFIARVLGQGGEFLTELDYTFRSRCCTRLVLCTSFQHLGDRQFPDTIKYLTLEFRNTNDIVSWIRRRQMVASACQGQAGEEGLRSVFRFHVIWQLQRHAPRKCQIPEYL